METRYIMLIGMGGGREGAYAETTSHELLDLAVKNPSDTSPVEAESLHQEN